jgi:hypothetical protein
VIVCGHERVFGWINPKDHPVLLKAARSEAPSLVSEIPRAFSLVPEIPLVNQLSLGSCAANSTSSGIRHAVRRMCGRWPDVAAKLGEYFSQLGIAFDPENPDLPSRLALYWLARCVSGDVHQDSGTTNGAVADAAATAGWCPESVWEYNVEGFKCQPPDKVFRISYALRGLIGVNYTPMPKSHDLFRRCLASGYPFVFGTLVSDKYSSPTGPLSVPSKSETILGGHSMLCAGYDVDGNYLSVGSWGPDHHEPGMPPGVVRFAPEYFDWDETCDFWIFPDPTGTLLR